MEESNAAAAFATLAQEHRLAVYRLLVREEPNTLPAGEKAERIRVPPSTLSHHLAALHNRPGLDDVAANDGQRAAEERVGAH